MNKTTIIIIIAVVVLILVLVFSLKSSPAQTLDLSMLNEKTNVRKDCRQICDPICKKYPLINIFKRQRCEGQCKSDCALGKDVTKMTY